MIGVYIYRARHQIVTIGSGQQKAQVAANIFKEEAWHPVIEWFCNKLCSKAGLGHSPSELSALPTSDEELTKSVRDLEMSLRGKQPGMPDFQSPETNALCRHIGKDLGNMNGCGFPEWNAIHAIIDEYWPIYEAWEDQLKEDEIARYEAQILASATSPCA